MQLIHKVRFVRTGLDIRGRQLSRKDMAGTTMALCNAYCAIVSEALASSYNKILSCIRDGYGQDLEYANDTSRKSIIEYEADTGRVGRMQNAGAWFTFLYLPGTDLKSRLH